MLTKKETPPTPPVILLFKYKDDRMDVNLSVINNILHLLALVLGIFSLISH